jgi:hypothetical protein
MTPSEILRAAADLIGPDGCWAQGAYARDAAGSDAYSAGDKAVCWCLHGAVRWVAHRNGGIGSPAHHMAMAALITACKAPDAMPSNECVHAWNDKPGRAHADAVAKLLEAARIGEAA